MSSVAIGRRINISNNDNLVSLIGLQGTSILESSLIININNSLTNLRGLEGITSVGGDGLGISGNNNLTTLNGLNNVTSINGLLIRNNTNLSVCNIESVCNYLENDGNASIINNAPNCNSAEEVLASCTVSTTSSNNLSKINIYPNPTNGIFNLQGIPNSTYQIHNISGQIIQQGGMQNDLLIDISPKVQGVYFISITVNSETFVRRIVKK